jgi:hypothetical protein
MLAADSGSPPKEETTMARVESLPRWITRAGLAVLAGAAMVAGAVVATTPAHASDVNPYSPAAGHPYRHGAVPTLEAAAQMRTYRAANPTKAPAASGLNLSYGGAVDGIGVTTGKPRVYLIFWGSQWGSAGTDANGNTTLSGDPVGMAPRLQQLMKGIGAAGELWSGVATQYCEGVPKGTQTCPDSAPHVAYPTGGALAGVWLDNGSAAPASATERQLGVEAITAASHFGNTSPGLNRNAQYVVVSPHGTTPDGFNTPKGGFCAWHDWNGDPTLVGGPIPSTVGDIAFTNLPYVTDAGGSCGAGFVNTPGQLDGVTIVEGHEYIETITDQNPAGGWTDASGEENADKCAWLKTGPGASANVLFTTGSFAMQSSWANDASAGAGGCLMSHPIIGGNTGGDDFALSTSPKQAAVTAGRTSTLTATVTSTVVAGSPGTVTLTVANLPAGVTGSLSPTTVPPGGSSTLTLHVGSSAKAGNYLVSISGKAGTLIRQAAYALAVVAPTGSVFNGSFEKGLTSWTVIGQVSAVGDAVHSGFVAARVGTPQPGGTSILRKTFTVNAGQTHLRFWYLTVCTDIVQLDWFTASLRDRTTGKTTTLVGHICTIDPAFHAVNATVVPGHSYSLILTDHDDGRTGDPTYTYVDDVSTF